MFRTRRIRVIVSIFAFIILVLSVPRHDYSLFVCHAASAKKAPVTASSFAKSMTVGWNLGNSLDSYYEEPTGDGNLRMETIWGNPKVTKEQIDYVKSLGFNTIRIPVSWYYHTYTDERGDLRVHPDWLKRVKEVVDYCLEDDLYVLLDSHHDGIIFHAGVDDKEFATIRANVTSIWCDIADYFKDEDGRLMFEAFNELDNYEKYWQFGKKAASQMNDLNQIFVNVVRNSGGYNPKRVLVVPTLLDKHDGKFLDAFELPADTVSDRLVVTVHYYPQQYDEAVEPTLTELEEFSKRVGAPVVIGEWGTKEDYTPASFRGIHAANFVARAKAHGLNCVYWDNGSNYAIVDRKNLTCNQEIVDGIMNPKACWSEESSNESGAEASNAAASNNDSGFHQGFIGFVVKIIKKIAHAVT